MQGMSIWGFLWKAVWREASAVTRAIQISLVGIPTFIAFLTGVAGVEWSNDQWPSEVWLAIAAVMALCSVIFSITRRAYELEKDLESKIEISDPIETVWPKRGLRPKIRVVQIDIINLSNKTLRNCRVREDRLTNTYGKDAEVLGRPFRLSTERTVESNKDYGFTNTFVLSGRGARERIDIARLNERNSDSNVEMMYASKAGVQMLNSIPRHFFPHILTIRFTSDDVPISETRTYKLTIDTSGHLKLEKKY